MDQKGTLSVDLLFATFMVLIILGYTSTLISDRFNIVDESQELVEARYLAENIAGAVNQAYAGGEGHIIKIKTPYKIGNVTYYRVLIDSSGVLVEVGGRQGLAYIVPKKISGSDVVLQNSTVILQPASNYVMMNKREGNGENWIVIK